MRMDKMTNKLQSAFSDAQSFWALKKENSQIDLHLLLSLIEQKRRDYQTPFGANRIQYK